MAYPFRHSKERFDKKPEPIAKPSKLEEKAKELGAVIVLEKGFEYSGEGPYHCRKEDINFPVSTQFIEGIYSPDGNALFENSQAFLPMIPSYTPLIGGLHVLTFPQLAYISSRWGTHLFNIRGYGRKIPLEIPYEMVSAILDRKGNVLWKNPEKNGQK